MHTAQATGKRSYDASLNIVPYIDMLMVLMIFLMMTAVWSHTASLQVSTSAGSCDGAQCEAPSPPTLVRISANGFHVGVATAIDVKAAVALAACDPKAPLDIVVDDGVTLERVTLFLDAAKGAGLREQSLRGVLQ